MCVASVHRALYLQVLNTLVHFGASENILTSGKPHLGTDHLVRILRRFRQHLMDLGADIRFNSRVDTILTKDGRACGVKLADGVFPSQCT